MRWVFRIIGGVVGAFAAFPVGQMVGCGLYESAGPEYRQCGYEFEGIGHVLTSIAVGVLVLGFLGQWVAGWVWRQIFERDEQGSRTSAR